MLVNVRCLGENIIIGLSGTHIYVYVQSEQEILLKVTAQTRTYDSDWKY